MAEVSEGKLTRPSEDELFSMKEIIDALRKSEDQTTTRWKRSYKKNSDSVGAHLHGMNSSIVKMKEGDDRYKQISEKIKKRKEIP